MLSDVIIVDKTERCSVARVHAIWIGTRTLAVTRQAAIDIVDSCRGNQGSAHTVGEALTLINQSIIDDVRQQERCTAEGGTLESRLMINHGGLKQL